MFNTEISINFENEVDYSLFKIMLGNGMKEMIANDPEMFGGFQKVFGLYTSILDQIPTLLCSEELKGC